MAHWQIWAFGNDFLDRFATHIPAKSFVAKSFAANRFVANLLRMSWALVNVLTLAMPVILSELVLLGVL